MQPLSQASVVELSVEVPTQMEPQVAQLAEVFSRTVANDRVSGVSGVELKPCMYASDRHR